MHDDAIKAALDVATRNACGACDCSPLQPGCLSQVAKEVAAFMRSLPLMDGVGPEGKSFPIDLTGIAVAVERYAINT